MSWEGVAVRQPDDPALTAAQRKSAIVIIGILNRDVDIPPLIESLRSMGYSRIITLPELYDLFGAELGNWFWLAPKSFYSGLENVISQAAELWADERSRKLYRSIVRFRLANDFAALPEPDKHSQYFPPDLPPWRSPLRFVDGGAFEGDTIEALLAHGSPVEAVAAFEPDQGSFRKLAERLAESRGSVSQMYLFPCGLDSCTRQVRFCSGQGESSHVSADGEGLIQCVSLDEALWGFEPTLVKLDVEGAEYDALCGARRTVTQHRPGLAVCLYHKPEDLWQIPLLLQSWEIGGSFYLRAHGYNAMELVMYWLPHNHLTCA